MTDLEPEGETDLAEAIRSVFAAPHRRGLVVVISDFLDEAGPQALHRIAPLRHDLLAVQVWSPGEARPDVQRQVELVDSETGMTTRVDATPQLLKRYRQLAEQHTAELESYCHTRGWSYLKALTTTPFEDLILGVFRNGRFLR